MKPAKFGIFRIYSIREAVDFATSFLVKARTTVGERRIYGANIRLSRLRSCWNEQCLASIPLAVFVSNSIPHSRSICRVNPRRYRNSGADGDGSAGRVHPTDRLFRLSGRLAGIRYVAEAIASC